MATKTLDVRMQQLRKTTEQWITVDQSNKPLLSGEIGFDYGTDGFKVGDGSTLYTALPEYSCVRTGTIIFYGSGYTPYGYLLCNSAAVSRTTYAKLFNVLGTKYGAGNGSTTFNLPDMREKYPKGFGDSTNISGGANTVTLTVNQIPPHKHGIRYGINTSGPGNLMSALSNPMEYVSTNPIDNSGGGQAHNNEPAYTKAYYYIKY